MNEIAEPVTFDPHRFQSAAAHYLAGRPHYAPELIGRVARLCGLTDGDRVLDLGCGPGQLAVGFAFHAGSVLAVDPEPEMLRVAAPLRSRRRTSNSGAPVPTISVRPSARFAWSSSAGRSTGWTGRRR